jgi:DNA-binding NtrC family response regulator
VAEGRFHSDLYDRLNVYPISLLPLRERREELRALALYFLKRYSHALRKEVPGMSEGAMGWLERYPWPGNVRELKEVIEQAVARCQGPRVTAQDLPQALREPSRAPVSRGEAVTRPSGGIAMADLEKHLIRQALEQAHGNKSHAAKQLGLSRTQLRTRMRHYGLEDERMSPPGGVFRSSLHTHDKGDQPLGGTTSTSLSTPATPAHTIGRHR